MASPTVLSRFVRGIPIGTTSARSISSLVAPLLMSPSKLHDLTHSSDVSILDASWAMPNSPRKPRAEFMSKHIPGAKFLDLDEVSSTHELGLKHMMPPERVFADVCENFGIDSSSHVVLYDSQGVFSSPRALFMFRAFGHTNSSVLDGGLPRWEAEGLLLDTGALKETKKVSYPTPSLNRNAIRSYEQIVSNSTLNPVLNPEAELIVDARSRGRYLGVDPEPRPGLPSGHIPNSFSLPFNTFLQSVTAPNSRTYTIFRPPSEIRKALIDAVGVEQAELVIKGGKPVVTSCGSGMTAGVLWLGLKLLGVDKVGLYDESWTGYAARKSSKIEKSL